MNTTKTQKIIYGIFITIIVGLIAYIMIIQPQVKAGNEIIEIQARIQVLQDAIKEHQAQYDSALVEKDNCIKQCETSWNKQAEMEHIQADVVRGEIAALNERLGLILESKLQ